MVWQAVTRLEQDNRTEIFLPRDSAVSRTLAAMQRDFGNDAVHLVVAEGDVFTPAYLERLRSLHGAFEALKVELPLQTARPATSGANEKAFDDFGSDDPGWGDEAGGGIFEQVLSLVNVRQTRSIDGGLAVGGLLDTWPGTGALPALKRRVLADPTLAGRLVGRNATHALLVLRTGEQDEAQSRAVVEAVREVLEQHDREGFRLLLAGLPAFNADMGAGIMHDNARALLMLGAVMFVCMTLIFRHRIGILAPLLVVGQGSAWTYGSMAMAGVPQTMITGMVGCLVMIVGIGSSVHVQSVYRDLRRDGHPNTSAIVEALASTGMPILYATLTTCFGFLGFLFASMPPIQHVGVFGALGVLYILINTLILVPALLSYNRSSLGAQPAGPRGDFIARVLQACDQLSKGPRARRWVTLGVSLSVSVAAGLSATTVQTGYDPMEWFPESEDMVRATRAIDAHVGGGATVELLIAPNEGRDIRDRELLLGLAALERHIRDYRDPRLGALVASTSSVLDVLRETWRALHGGQASHYRLPDTQRGVHDAFMLFQNAGPDELKRLVTVDLQRAIMTVRVKWLDAAAYGPLTEHIAQGAREHLTSLAVVHPTGSVFNMYEVVAHILGDLLRSFGTALVLVTLMMVGLLRDLRLGLIAMAPNLWPILLMVGVMGAFGIPMELTNVLLASIAIGIAVDDTIHFLHHFRRHHELHGDVDAAIAHAFSHAGRAMVVTSFVLALGFGSFLFAWMGNTRIFGLLAAVAVVGALVADLIITPALLRVSYRSRTRSRSPEAPRAAEKGLPVQRLNAR